MTYTQTFYFRFLHATRGYWLHTVLSVHCLGLYPVSLLAIHDLVPTLPCSPSVVLGLLSVNLTPRVHCYVYFVHVLSLIVGTIAFIFLSVYCCSCPGLVCSPTSGHLPLGPSVLLLFFFLMPYAI